MKIIELPERITLLRYYWDEERPRGGIVAWAFDADESPDGLAYRLEKTCYWRPCPGADLIRAVNHHLREVAAQPRHIRYCPVCGGRIVIKDK